MPAESGGRTSSKRTTGSAQITNKSVNNRSKSESRPASGAGRKRDAITSLFSPKRPASRKAKHASDGHLPRIGDPLIRGQQNQPAQQQQQQQPTQPQQLQQQQQEQQHVPLRQAASASSLEAKNENPPVGNWGSLGKEGSKGNPKGNYNSKGPAKGSRMQELEREIEVLRKERGRLESNLREASCDAQNLRELQTELASIKEQHSLELERLTEENETLRARLRDVTHSPLSDSEKQQLLLDASRLHNSAPASIAIPQDEATTPITSMPHDSAQCTTPDWDKHSSSSVSEVSVACLQDRILQMEETHYSTNEELQATIQELSDLQAQLTELQTDNERLTEEKVVLLESLCRQTEKLEDSRSKVDTLQGLLLREEQPQEPSKGYNTEREQKLVDLLKSAQEERESLLQKQEELTSELKVLRAAAEVSATETERLTKCVHLLESTVEVASNERKQLDMELAEARQEGANRSIEISRLATLLENARAKIEELEQSRQVENKSEADELLDAARREKDTLETQAAALQEQLARSHCDHDRLKDQFSQLQEEHKVARNNAKSAIDDLEYRLDQLKDERLSVTTELQLVRDSLAELQAQCQRHLEDKRELKAALNEAQRREREAQTRQYELERALAEERKLRQEEVVEWEQFQTDLLMTVRVANDFKTEAQSELERVVMENKAQRDKLRALEAQLDKLNKASTPVPQYKTYGGSTIKNSRKPVSNILKRGRTIVKKRHDSKKGVLSINASNDPNLCHTDKNAEHKEPQDLVAPEVICLSAESFDHARLTSFKEPVQLDEKLISGKEIEFCPTFDVDKVLSDLVDSRVLQNRTDDGKRSDESLKSSESHPKSNVTNAATKSSLLKDIKGIQNIGKDFYGINISNSKFYVPMNYVFTGVENAMDDLKFEVDPGMRKVLQECTRSANSIAEQESRTLSNPELEKDKENLSEEFDATSKSEEKFNSDDCFNKKRKLFPNKIEFKAESNTGGEILILNTVPKSNISRTKLWNKNDPVSLESIDLHGKSKSNEELLLNDYDNVKRSAIHYRNRIDQSYLRPQSVPVESYLYKNLDTKKTNTEATRKEKTVAILSSLENLPRSPLDSPTTPKEMNLYSKENIRSSDSPSPTQKISSESQRIRSLSLCEANRLKRIHFLNTNLSDTAESTVEQIVSCSVISDEKQSPESDANVSPNSKGGQTDSLFNGKDKTLIGRTSSLREKFEAIIEDVELRPGRQIGTKRDRKSASSVKNVVACIAEFDPILSVLVSYTLANDTPPKYTLLVSSLNNSSRSYLLPPHVVSNQ